MSQFDAILLFPGWGCPARWLDELGRTLSKHYSTSYYLIDLPGMTSSAHESHAGNISAMPYVQRVNQWCDELSEEWQDKRLLLVGWSYGGMLASMLLFKWLHDAPSKECSCQLVTLGASSRFVAERDEQGVLSYMQTATAKEFYQRVQNNLHTALRYFLSLMAKGEPRQRWAHLRADMQRISNDADAALFCESLKHLYELRLQYQWHYLQQRECLISLYFNNDTLMPLNKHAVEHRGLNIVSGSHLAPVISAHEVSHVIFSVLNNR